MGVGCHRCLAMRQRHSSHLGSLTHGPLATSLKSSARPRALMEKMKGWGVKLMRGGLATGFQKNFWHISKLHCKLGIGNPQKVGHCCRWFHTQFGQLGFEKYGSGSYWHRSKAVSFVGVQTTKNQELGIGTPQKRWTLLYMMPCTVWAARALK